MPSEVPIRGRLADDDGGRPRLFDDAVECEPGKGEYRGMEFLHVRAGRIINEVPKASKVPFRYTINAYRGCSHACSYCAEGSTPVLMADGTTKPLSRLRTGEEIYGTERVGRYRRYVRTKVLAHWCTVKTAYRVTLEDGTELVTSGDHRFLTSRGWKHVAGTEQGRDRRPHLTTGNSLLGTGRFAEPPPCSADYRMGYLCGLIRGDGHLASRRYLRPNGAPWMHHVFRLALVDLEPLRRANGYLLDNDVGLSHFVFQRAAGDRRELQAVRTQAAAAVAKVSEVTRWPEVASEDWIKGFLAGIFDAEGSYSRGILRIANTDPRIIEQTVAGLTKLGFRYAMEQQHINRSKPITYIRLLGGLVEHLRFFHTVEPAITRKRTIEGQAIKNAARLRVVSIDRLGIEIPMYDITTGTGDFIANGVVSHNCFARPTHEYLGLNRGDDFERRIVVKVNAVERLRGELASPRWNGDHIAMGTNTDPYQRCEAKYRLTRGIVGVLSAAQNPFSILTKSTLILRDLDVLAEAVRRTDVHANVSIGTLDDHVWRLTEPGTPHPRQRVEAVARLNQAGVPCGVLIAPVLPGLSDHPSQVEAVVKAVVAAGATSVSAILLHLRPGVREHYLGWLATQRPDLVPAYEELYPRAYAPKATQEQLGRLVADLVRAHGGTASNPRRARAVGDDRRPAGASAAGTVAAPPVTQLSLGV